MIITSYGIAHACLQYTWLPKIKKQEESSRRPSNTLYDITHKFFNRGKRPDQVLKFPGQALSEAPEFNDPTTNFRLAHLIALTERSLKQNDELLKTKIELKPCSWEIMSANVKLIDRDRTISKAISRAAAELEEINAKFPKKLNVAIVQIAKRDRIAVVSVDSGDSITKLAIEYYKYFGQEPTPSHYDIYGLYSRERPIRLMYGELFKQKFTVKQTLEALGIDTQSNPIIIYYARRRGPND